MEGVISAGEKVKVVWGKSKKKYDAIVVASHEQRSSPVTVARQRHTPAPVFTFELGSPAPEPVCEQQPPRPAISEGFRSSTSQERHCDCCQKIESKLEMMMSDLKDYVAGEFARLAVRMNALEKTVGNLPTQANSTFYGGIPDFSTYCFPEIQPNQTQPNQIQLNQTQPNQTQPNQTQLNQTQPNQTQPNQTQPNQTQPNQTQPNQTQLNQTQLNQTQLNQTQPNQTQPNQTQPNQTQPNQTQPNQVQLNQTLDTPIQPNQIQLNQTLDTPIQPNQIDATTNEDIPYSIPQSTIQLCLNGCKSRRNLAGRLTLKLFTNEERRRSNCRGVVGKQPLYPIKVRTIFNVCYQQFPMDRLENPLQAEKEMRNAIDEQCRKTRQPLAENNF